MIIKKKISELKFFKPLVFYFRRLIFFLGLVSLFFIILISFYYYSSGLQKLYSPAAVVKQVNEKVLKRYIGFDLTQSLNYLEIIKLNIIGSLTSNKLETVYLEINQESILGLELQRKLRSESGGELTDEEKIYLPARIKFNNENYNVKIRTKGVRRIHWNNKDATSYKVDIRGEKRLWGMEEFSFQKPITRNYTYEYLFHNLLGHVGLLNIKYFFVNLYLNDQSQGVYAVEESFSKELVEGQKKRNGPIFSLKDEIGEYFPNVSYELYSDDFWIKEYPNLIKNSFAILNNLREEKFEINNHFDIDKWAKYFAIMDLTGAYHGSLLKSVKLFYNPTTALFEPIGYDLHKGAGIFGNFILLDFLQEGTKDSKVACSFICNHKDWYLKFLKLDNGEINFEFVKKYIDYLIEYSSEEFIVNFISIYQKELSKYNNAIYKDYSKTDIVRWTGAGFFVYDDSYLFNRAKLIKGRINSTDLDKIEISKSEKKFFYEDYNFSNFPFLAQTKDCEKKSDEKNYFFAGKMSIDFESTCKTIKFLAYNGEFKSFKLKENIRIMSDKNIYSKKEFNLLSKNPSFSKVSKNSYKTIQNVIIKKNSIINQNEKFIFEKNISLNIINGSTLFVEGDIDFINDKNNLSKIYSEDNTGSLIFINNDYNFKNLDIRNLSKPKLDNYILYGGVNFINSKVKLDNIFLKNSMNEDGLNLINSKSDISNIYFENIKADAFDIDFGKLNFHNINCSNINNDCLDISGATVEGNELITKDVLDKGISVGENSSVKVNQIKILNNNIALAVKDGSKAYFKDVFLDNNNYDIVLFNKKYEFLKPSLRVENINRINENKILQSNETSLLINDKSYEGKFEDDFINSKIY